MPVIKLTHRLEIPGGNGDEQLGIVLPVGSHNITVAPQQPNRFTLVQKFWDAVPAT